MIISIATNFPGLSAYYVGKVETNASSTTMLSRLGKGLLDGFLATLIKY